MDIRREVAAIIGKKLQVAEAELSPDKHFRSLPNFDSMRALELILEIEKAFDIEFDDDVTFRIETLGNFQDLVEQLCLQRAQA